VLAISGIIGKGYAYRWQVRSVVTHCFVTYSSGYFIVLSGAEGVQQQDKDYTVTRGCPARATSGIGARQGWPSVQWPSEGTIFRVFEDGVLQDISLFKHEDVPMSVGLVIDNSGSMHKQTRRVNRAALTFARESNPDDETCSSYDFDDSRLPGTRFHGQHR